MRIGQLAQSVGVDTQTIRFYERQGLLPPPGRQENGYRVYTEKHVEPLSGWPSSVAAESWACHWLRFTNYRAIRTTLISLVPPSTPCSMITPLMCGRR